MNKEDATPFFLWANTPLKSIVSGVVVSAIVSALAYPIFFRPFAQYVTGLEQFAVIFGMLFSLGLFALVIAYPGVQTGQPQHHRVLKFLGEYVNACLPGGEAWVPPFFSTTEVNVGEQMVDIRDSEVFIKGNRLAFLHLQLQMEVVESYRYAVAGATLTMPIKPVYKDAVIEAIVAKVKEATRLQCEKYEEFDDLNEEGKKQQITDSVMGNRRLLDEFQGWGVEARNLFVRTVILPEKVVAAANLVEIEKREREAEKMDVETLTIIVENLKKLFPEMKPEKLLEAAQLQQKRISGIVTRGGALNILDTERRAA